MSEIANPEDGGFEVQKGIETTFQQEKGDQEEVHRHAEPDDGTMYVVNDRRSIRDSTVDRPDSDDDEVNRVDGGESQYRKDIASILAGLNSVVSNMASPK
jgi:hypothetical protein